MPKQTFFNLPDGKRERILDAAIEEFADKGYGSASITRVVNQAKIAKGSFYQYFDDKQDLYEHLLEDASQRQAKFMSSQNPPNPDMHPFDYLRWLMRIGLHFNFMNPRIMKVAQQAFDGAGPLPEQIRQQTQENGIRFLKDLLKRGIDNGHVRDNVDLDASAFVLFTVSRQLNAYVMRQLNISADEPNPAQVLQDREEEVDTIFESVLSVIDHGIRVPDAD